MSSSEDIQKDLNVRIENFIAAIQPLAVKFIKLF